MGTQRVRTAIVGTGFMGRVHLEAVRRLGFADVVVVVGSHVDKARAMADAFGVPHASADYRAALRDVDVDVVHVCTPNVQHYAMAAAALEAGTHVICEKPLAMSSAEAIDLVNRATARRVRHATCYNLRYYPMVQQMRRLCEAGELGDVLIAQGTYSQDWLLYDTDWNWRVDSSEAGSLRAMGDIGSHWCDMVEHVTGLRITSLSADLATFHKTRKRPRGSVETFAGKLHRASDSYEETAIDTEDFAAVLFHLDERARGALTVSQVSAGCKNRLSIEIYGSRASVAWNQERPDELWMGRRDGPNAITVKDPALMAAAAATYADLPGGHSEGYDDTFKQLFRRFYRAVLDPSMPTDYPSFDDGLRQMHVLDAVRASHERRGWVELAAEPVVASRP
jgi:predicted dehydrogenase